IDLAETTYPDSWPEVDLDPLQGKSLRPIFEGKVREPHEKLYFAFGGNRAVLEGPWKLVTHRSSRWELYHLEEDGTEMNDLAAQYPERVKEMSEWWHLMAEKVDRLNEKARRPVAGTEPPMLKKDGRPAQKEGEKKKA
ncbi:MAG: hypothetical protein AAGJ31_13890, partial [Verrucomicrobiota bacterium]